MRQLFSYYDNITLIFANLILKYKNEIKIFENQKSPNYLFIRYLNLFLYIILFRGNLFLAGISWKKEISRHREYSLTFSYKNSFLYH